MDHNSAMDTKMCDLLAGDQMKDYCRVCMAHGTNMKEIFNIESNIINQIEFCTGLKLTQQEELPSRICCGCYTNLSVAYNFKTTCINTDEVLQKLLMQNVKVEVEDDYDCFDETSGTEMHDVELEVKKEVVIKKEDMKCKPRIKLKSLPVQKRVSQPLKKKVDPLYCETCRVNFKTKKLREDHDKDLHLDTLETFICEICGKVFLHRSSLYTHSRSHLPPQFSCPDCDYSTWHKHDLNKHILRHRGTKRFQCEFCTASYYTSSNLLCHIRRFHERLKPHECHLCDKKFYDTTKLNRHLDSHNDVKRFECDICHSHFTRRCYWKKHLQRQHNVTIPPQRPGRQRLIMTVGEDLMNKPVNTFQKYD